MDECEHSTHGNVGVSVVFAGFRGGGMLRGHRIVVNCDNMAVVSVLSLGRSRDLFLQAGMREIAYLLLTAEVEMKVQYIVTHDNLISDWLSRWADPNARRAFRAFARGRSLHKVVMKPSMLKFSHNW